MTTRTLSFAAALCLFSLAPPAAHSQGAEAAGPVAEFVSLLDRNATAVTVGTPSSQLRYRVAVREGCDLTVELTTAHEYGKRTSTHKFSLADLAPAAEVEKWRNQEIWNVRLRTHTGEKKTFWSQADRTHPTTDVEIAFSDPDVAERVANAANAAIKECGGKPYSAAALKALATKKLENAEDEKIAERCHRLVGQTLIAPEEATYQIGTIIRSSDEPKLTVSGTVTGANRVGGRVSKRYVCEFDKVGDSWVPRGTPSLF